MIRIRGRQHPSHRSWFDSRLGAAGWETVTTIEDDYDPVGFMAHPANQDLERMEPRAIAALAYYGRNGPKADIDCPCR